MLVSYLGSATSQIPLPPPLNSAGMKTATRHSFLMTCYGLLSNISLGIKVWSQRLKMIDVSALQKRSPTLTTCQISTWEIYGSSWQPKRPSNINQKYVITNIYLKNWTKLIFKGSIQGPIKITNAEETQSRLAGSGLTLFFHLLRVSGFAGWPSDAEMARKRAWCLFHWIWASTGRRSELRLQDAAFWSPTPLPLYLLASHTQSVASSLWDSLLAAPWGWTVSSPYASLTPRAVACIKH